MKRSKRIRLILIGGLSSAVLAGCDQKPAVSTQNFYTNNFYVPGAGYYHAPFRQWFSLPYNHFDAQKQVYFYGGMWGPQPFASYVNISSPTPQAVESAQITRTDIVRGGFGYTGGGYYRSGSGFYS